jgi:hypothetical protein
VTQGIVFFAYNTEQIDYVKLAIVAARYVRRHMPDFPVCLITSAGDLDWYERNTPDSDELLEAAFDEIVLAEPGHQNNQRTHHDSPWHHFVSEFRNGNKHRVIDLSPYDQTLLLDIDYILQNDQLAYVFDAASAVTLFHHAENLIREPAAPAQRYLYNTGIPMLWSTVVYFDRRQELARMFFDMWAHVADNYEFYKFLYGFPGKMFRTDFCVSIAAHVLNGMGAGELVEDFTQPMIYMSQKDDIAKINGADEWIYLVNDREEPWENSFTKIKNENVHVMNKRAIERHYDDIMKQLDGDRG